MLIDVVTNQRFEYEGADCWPLERARQVEAILRQSPPAGDHDFHLVHTLTYVSPEDHDRWAKATDFGARKGPGTMPR